MRAESADGERRRLVFTNLVNGLPVARVMEAFKLSEKEVLVDFAFVSLKLRSYRFERAMPILKCSTIAEARDYRLDCLWTLQRCNLDKLPGHGPIETLPFDPTQGQMSLAEQRLLEARLRSGR